MECKTDSNLHIVVCTARACSNGESEEEATDSLSWLMLAPLVNWTSAALSAATKNEWSPVT